MKFNRKGIYLAFPKKLVDRFELDRYIYYTSEQYGSWTITFWQDFQAKTHNTRQIKNLSINGTNTHVIK